MIDNYYYMALEKAYTAQKALLTSDTALDNQFECFYAISNMLHWSMDCIERLSNTDTSKYDGVRFANNQLKHNKKIISLHKIIGGLGIPEEGIPFGVINCDSSTITPLLYFPAMEYKWGEVELSD